MKALYLLPVSLLLAGGVQADTSITFVQNGSNQTNVISIHNGVVHTAAGEGQRMLWNTNNSQMLMVNDARKQYMVIDNKTIDQAAGFMDQMKQQMMAQLQNMPAEQRQAIEKQMGISLEQPTAPKVELKNTGKSRTVSGVKCTQSDIMTNGQKTAEVCIATVKDAKIAAEDYATMKKMFDLSRTMAEKTSSMGGAPGASVVKDMPDLNGVPMEFKDLKHGETVTIASIDSGKKLNPANFTPGQGYQQVNPFQQMQQQMPGMMPPRQ